MEQLLVLLIMILKLFSIFVCP
uniref:Uncharacterized protein n=1 Tax=Arundo donax TaxID=35708 RepID=A0A0A9GMD5_ARUDO